MRTKKILSAVTAMILTATAMLGTGALQASAAEKKTLTFDLRSGGKNEIKVSAEQIAAGDFTVPVDIYIPENPGVNAINLKLQVNDGQVDKNGKFGNYGLYLNDAAFCSPFCFDSASKGDVTASIAQTFNSKDMNVSWVFSQDPKQKACCEYPDGGTGYILFGYHSLIIGRHDLMICASAVEIAAGF